MRNQKKILLVEDNELDRKILVAALKKREFEVICLADGAECIATIEKENPDLLLLDILLPGIHGNKLLHLIREKKSSIELPILMTTVKGDPKDIIESLALGANDYLVKPIDIEVACMRIRTQLYLADLSKRMAKLESLNAVAALVATYNHEINNPLAVAISSLKGLESLNENKSYQRLERALWRITDIVKELKEAVSKSGLQFEVLGKNAKVIKLG